MNGSTFCCALNSLRITAQSQVMVTLGNCFGASFAQIQGLVQGLQPSNDIPGNYIFKLKVSSASNINNSVPGTLTANISVASIVAVSKNDLQNTPMIKPY